MLFMALKALRELVLRHRHKLKSCTTKFNSIFRLGTLILYKIQHQNNDHFFEQCKSTSTLPYGPKMNESLSYPTITRRRLIFHTPDLRIAPGCRLDYGEIITPG
jgi:hypothetical protein